MASKKKTQKKQVTSDDESVEEAEVEAKPKASFALLMDDSDDAGSQSEGDSDVEVKPVTTKKNMKKDPPKPEPKKGKKKKKGDEDDEDLEKMLAELDLEYQGKKQPEQKKELGKTAEADDEPEGEVTEASKKKDKKKKKKGKEDSVDKEVKEESPAPIVEAEAPETAEDGDDASAAAAKKKKDKKKKKKAGEKETAPEETKEEDDEEAGDKKKKGGKDDKKGKKGPSKTIVAAMQEALKKQKEEEERLQREEEERIRREEELERQRLEKERLEKEKKELKKQREKEKREQLKAEGLLLTAKQKQKLNRAKASLEAWEATGIKVPDTTEKKVRPGTRIRPKKEKPGDKEQSPVESAEPAVTTPETEAPKENGAVKEESVEPKEEVADSWELLDEDDEEAEKPEASKEPERVEPVKAAEPEPTKIVRPEPTKKPPPKKQVSSESESETESDSDESDSDQDQRVRDRIRKRREENEKKRDPDNLRAPVICVLGHVDTGKTKILDKLRRTNVQDSEAGGITQQIGATNVPLEAIREQTKIVKAFDTAGIKVPGLLIIDTPGHESFSNLRSRGSSLCDLAILVVDIMHGLEPQTIESINLLKSKKTPFVVALNKVDRLFEWQSNPKRDIRDVLKSQKPNTQLEFQQRSNSALLQLAEQGLNAKLFYENPDPKTYISVVPTSAITGDGMANLIAMVVELNQKLLTKRLMYSDELQATVLEVKAITGHGTTIDVILVNGTLRVGDEIVLAGFDGPIVTQIRALLMPKPLRELRVKNDYAEPKEVRAAQGVKIAAKDLEKAIAGLNMLVAKHPDEVDILKEEVSGELKSALKTIKLQERGVYVQASTLGSLEALLEFLKTSDIPYSNVRIGPVAKRDVMKASIMLEHDSQYAVILAFDVRVERDAQEMADSVGVKIFQADIIYHLFDKFTKYREELKQKKRDEFKHIAVFPCKLRVLPQFVFNSRDPIVVGVMVESGIVKEGTPICVPSKDFVEIGVVSTIEVNHKQVEVARKGQEVCVKIENVSGDAPKMYGRHFDHTDLLVSKISRQSIDACKDYFRDDLTKADWQLMIELKKLFQIL